MKQIAKKITEYVKKSKRAKLYGVFGLIYLIAVIFVMNDAWLYQTPIAKLTKVETSVAGESKSTRGTQEIKYKQKIRGVILNGTNKGKIVDFSNEYTYTGMLKQKYHKGDKVLLNGSENNVGSSIQCVKRDTELIILLGLLILVLMMIAGKKGLLTIVTVGINIVIFTAGFLKSGDDADVVAICNKMVIFFAIATLIGLNGIHRKTWAALLSTICVLAMIMGIFDVVISHSAELDYSTMEYLGSIDNPDEIFHAEILLSGLGAIMDVAVAIAVALSEIVTKRPEVTFRELFRSGREIGYDIMGTMINVLLFVFGCGLIPMCVIRMNNSVRFMTIIKLHIPCELCRFFIGYLSFSDRKYWNCTGNTSIYTDHICDDEINDKEGEEDMLMILGLILLFLIMIIGGDRGVISLIALVGNMLLLSLAIWLMAAGAPVLLVTIGMGIIISCVTLFYQNGTNEKTKSAFAAVLITMTVLFFFIYMVVWRSETGGLNEIQAAEDDVLYYNMNLDINMRNVATAVIILSTLGAVLDMALTVTTSVYEVSIHKPEMKLTELVESGMQIGREVIGTTVNTLLFAYLGESLLLFSYLKMQDYTLETLLNSKILFQNCVSMIFGAIACVVVMPVAAVLVGRHLPGYNH